MNIFDINWVADGWTTIQDANREKHQVEISCYAENGVVTQIRKRHNDGEEEKLTKQISAKYALPISIEDLQNILKNDEVDW